MNLKEDVLFEKVSQSVENVSNNLSYTRSARVKRLENPRFLLIFIFLHVQEERHVPLDDERADIGRPSLQLLRPHQQHYYLPVGFTLDLSPNNL